MKFLIALALLVSGAIEACSLSPDLARVQVAPNGDRLTLVVANSGATACTTVVSTVMMPIDSARNLVSAPAGCSEYVREGVVVWACSLGTLAAGGSATVAAEFGFQSGRPACLPVSVSAGGANSSKVLNSAAKVICSK